MFNIYSLIMFAIIAALGVMLCVRAVRRGDGAFRALYITLFVLSLYAAFLIKLNVTQPSVSVFLPFYKLFDLNQYGYASVLRDLLSYAVPFVLAGFLLIPAFPQAGLVAAFFSGMASALIFNIYPLFNEMPFVTDEYICAGLGLALGASLYSILAGLFKKKLPLSQLRLPVPLHSRNRNSLIYFVVVYLGIALVMVFDYGEPYAPIQFFDSETDLPESITLDCELGTDAAKANIYIPSNVPASDKAASLVDALGIANDAVYSDGTYTSSDDDQKLTVTDSGSWVYEFTGAVSGDAPTEADATAAVFRFFDEHDLITVDLYEVTDMVAHNNETGLTDGYDVYLSTSVNGMPLVGSSSLVVSVRGGDTITKIRRYDCDVLPSTIINIISPEKAYEKIAAGDCAYTLFAPAKSAGIKSCRIIYMANSSQGYYLPVWMFSCTAEFEDGTTGDFDIYVEAKK